MLKEKFFIVVRIIKPWVIPIMLFLVLRYTGMLSGIQSVTNGALMSAGILDADTAPNENTDFNYDFTIQNLEGKNIDVNDYKGKVVFLNIWATWCGPCRAEMASIEQLYSKVDKKKVSFIMLSIDKKGQLQQVKNFIASKQFTFPVFMPSQSLPEILQVSSIPTTFIIGKDGKVVSRQVGSTNFDTQEFKDYIEGLARKKN